jgi:hypothetical protein
MKCTATRSQRSSWANTRLNATACYRPMPANAQKKATRRWLFYLLDAKSRLGLLHGVCGLLGSVANSGGCTRSGTSDSRSSAGCSSGNTRSCASSCVGCSARHSRSGASSGSSNARSSGCSGVSHGGSSGSRCGSSSRSRCGSSGFFFAASSECNSSHQSRQNERFFHFNILKYTRVNAKQFPEIA